MKKIYLLLPLFLFSCSEVSSSSNPNIEVTINGNSQMKINETQQLSISENFDDIRWSSSNNFVARVNNTGLVTAYNVGSCIIKAETNYFTSSFNIEVIKEDINSFSSLLEFLQNYKETSAKEIHFEEKNSSSNRTNKEVLYRFESSYYIEKEESFFRLGNEIKDLSKTFYGKYNDYFYDILISDSPYVKKQKIVNGVPQDNEISVDNVKSQLNQTLYLNSFFNKFQDSYTGYVNKEDITIKNENNQIFYNSFSKHVWDNGINCDYKTFEAIFSINTDELEAIDYTINNYGDELFDVNNNQLVENATPIETYSLKITFAKENSKTECPIVPTDYFVNNINSAEYTKVINVNDQILASYIKLTSFAPLSAIDTDYLSIISVENPDNQIVLLQEGDTITAISKGKAKINFSMRYSIDVTYSLEVEVI